MRSRSNKFTLVELLVAFGVFSVLLVIFMQLFSSMRLAWTNTERRSETVSDVRIAMDMSAALLSALYYSSSSSFVGTGDTGGAEVGHFPFRADLSTTVPGRLLFASKTSYDHLPGSNPIRFIGLAVLNAAGTGFATASDSSYKLSLSVLSNEDANYYRYFPNFLGKNDDNELVSIPCSKALTNLQNALYPSNAATREGALFEVLDNVVDFKVRAYDEKGKRLSGVTDAVPHEIELSISVLNDQDFPEWKAMAAGTAKDEFLLKKQMIFTRRIFIGERVTLEVSE